MSLTPAIHDSLPYIDTEPSASERAAAQALIDAELETPSSESPSQSHPSLPPLQPQNFSPIILAELERIESQQGGQQRQPLKAIDTSRYEALSPPSSTTSNTREETTQAWRDALSRASVSAAYLTQRTTNLALLDRYGKNSWLVGNSQLEDILRDVERDLAARKAEIDGVVVERRAAQMAVEGEVKGLEEGWKKGVGRVVETEVAAEGVRRDILDLRREIAR